MIREATADDIPEIVRLGALFHKQASWPEIADYVPQDCEKTIRHLVESDDGLVFVIDDAGIVGMAGALLFPLYFNHSHRTGQELFWWVKPNVKGLPLLDALEQAARDRGCRTLTMLAMERLQPDVMARLYRMRGYRPWEHSFVRML